MFFLAKNFLSAPNHPSPVVCSDPSSDKSKAKKVISFSSIILNPLLN